MSISYTPTTVSSGYNTSEINANFTAIQTALLRAIDRGSVSGGNAMQQDLDLGSNNILNASTITCTELTVGGNSAAALAAAAAASAAAASTSETNAAASESNAATSETNAAASATEAYNWAQYAEDSLVPEGNMVDEYSAYHWAQKAAGIVSGDRLSLGNGATYANDRLYLYEDANINQRIHFCNVNTLQNSTSGFEILQTGPLEVFLQNHETTKFRLCTDGDVDQLVLLPTNGNIVIGSTSDSLDRFRIHKDSAASCHMRFTNSSTGETSTDGLRVGINNTGQGFITQFETSDFYIQTGGANNRVKIDSAGLTTLYGDVALDKSIYATGATGGSQGDDTANLVDYYADGKIFSGTDTGFDFCKFSTMQIHSDIGVNGHFYYSTYTITGTIPSGAWYTVGPVGSGATYTSSVFNPLTSLNDAIGIGVSIQIQNSGATSGNNYNTILYVAKNDSGTPADYAAAQIRWTNATGASNTHGNVAHAVIPTDANGVFKVKWTETGTGVSSSIVLGITQIYEGTPL